MTRLGAIARLLRDDSGVAAIETAIMLPVLALLSFGAFEASELIARNSELEGAAAEATAISLASRPRTDSEVAQIERVIELSTGLADEDVVLERKYRCGIATVKVDALTLCLPTDIVAEYVEITLTETHRPIWAKFGMGSEVNFTVTKSVQVG